MVIQSSDVAMGSGRTYQRQSRGRSSVRGWGEVLSETTSPTAKESRTITKNETVEVVELYQNYTASGRHAVTGKGKSEGRPSDEVGIISADRLVRSGEAGRDVSGTRTEGEEIVTRPLTLRELFSLLIRRRQEDFERFLENFRAGMNGAGRQLFVVRGDAGGWETVAWEGEETYESYEYENEMTGFESTGTVQTKDGRKIEFDTSLLLERTEFKGEKSAKKMGGFQLKDPLVVNFGTGSTELTDRSFSFDIDADGEMDNIAMLGQACGFLALDRNGDGIINDGRELFGTKSGDGFADLAIYDMDGNGWIDEADPIFDRLKIWSKDSAGKDVLVGLGVRGIGAIFLGRTPTEFTLKNMSGETQGVIRSTGLFLREDGSSGTVQQVDLAKKR